MWLGAPSFNATKGDFGMVSLRPSFVVERFLRIPKGNRGIDDRDDEAKPILPFSLLSPFRSFLTCCFLGSEIEPPPPSRPPNSKSMAGVPKDHEHIAGFVSYVVRAVVVVCFLPLRLLKAGANPFIWSGSHLCPTIPTYMF